jgi:hypothetical protein
MRVLGGWGGWDTIEELEYVKLIELSLSKIRGRCPQLFVWTLRVCLSWERRCLID